QKERDLELAARIGQSLLKKNKTLTERNEFLEEQVEHIRDEVSQLRHELSVKDELLQFYTSVAEDSEADSTCSTPIRRNESSSVQNYFPHDSLQRKLKDLEEENVVLRSEACHLKTETITYEEKEQQLVNDCVKELRDASIQISSIAEELAKKTEDAARQQEEMTHLLSQIVDLQKKTKSYTVENEELSQHLGAAKDAQRQLTSELRELEDKYAECMEMLHEAQEELKNLRNKTMPNSTPRCYHSLGLFPMDSLAAEIEGTMRKELQLDDPISEEQKIHHKRVFETVKHINQTVKQRSLAPSPMNIPGSNQSSSLNSALSSCMSTPRSSFYGGDISNIVIDNRTNSIILETESPDGSEDTNKKPGTPGTPGSHDLETALRRLSLRRENYLSERRFFEEDRERKLCDLAEKGQLYSSSLTPTESIMSLSTNHSGLSVLSFVSRSYLPEKLQIVKPLEGSATLHLWQQLAQPNLGGILDPRPGVVTKGFRPLELDLEEVYQLADFEEDESGDLSFQDLPTSTPAQPMETSESSTFPNQAQLDVVETQEQKAADDEVSVYHPGKCMSDTGSTYTFTTCRILHPSDELTRVTPRADVLPSTPPNSPTTQHQMGPPFEFRGSSPPYDNFLASKPASSILKEVRAESKSSCNSECQTDVSIYNLNLVDKLKRNKCHVNDPLSCVGVIPPEVTASQSAEQLARSDRLHWDAQLTATTPRADSGAAKTRTRCPPKRVPSADRFFSYCRLTMQPPRATASEDNAALGCLQASPQAPGQTKAVAGARVIFHLLVNKTSAGRDEQRAQSPVGEAGEAPAEGPCQGAPATADSQPTTPARRCSQRSRQPPTGLSDFIVDTDGMFGPEGGVSFS
ncbi:UNVERIFIED_CONTAM: hypothetical protein FKN15_032224, partial [Acipenser sinensis]